MENYYKSHTSSYIKKLLIARVTADKPVHMATTAQLLLHSWLTLLQ